MQMQFFYKFAKYKCKTNFSKMNIKRISFRTIIVISAMFFAAFTAYSANDGNKKLGLTTVVLDPGHGGKDPGCISQDGKTTEKFIVLDIAKRLRNKINAEIPSVKVIMTRSDDRFIELKERADIANRNNADLFISIHVNAVDTKKNKNWRNVKGFSIHALGRYNSRGSDLYSMNMDLCKRENSVILMEDDYTTKYQGFNPKDPESYIIFNLLQNANLSQSLEFGEYVNQEMSKGPITHSRGIHQDPFLVLWKTTMPAVLVECGFITSSDDLAKLRDPEARDKIATDLLNALKDYKKKYDSSVGVQTKKLENKPVESKPEPTVQPEAKEETPAQNNIESKDSQHSFGTQILASSKKMSPNDKFFKGYDVKVVSTGKLYKYIIGVSEDKSEGQKLYKEIKAKFPDSFFVEINGDDIKRIK